MDISLKYSQFRRMSQPRFTCKIALEAEAPPVATTAVGRTSPSFVACSRIERKRDSTAARNSALGSLNGALIGCSSSSTTVKRYSPAVSKQSKNVKRTVRHIMRNSLNAVLLQYAVASTCASNGRCDLRIVDINPCDDKSVLLPELSNEKTRSQDRLGTNKNETGDGNRPP